MTFHKGRRMEFTRIIAVRHGETAWNQDTRIQGHLDIGLNETGRWQAQRLAAALAHEDIDAIYASDLERAHHTALSVAQVKGLPVSTHVGLRERLFGDFQGRTFAEIEDSLPEQALQWRKRVPDFSPQGGESLLQFRERIIDTVQGLAAQNMGKQILIASHGGVMDVLYRAATGQDLQAPRTWELSNAAINRLLWSPRHDPAADDTAAAGAGRFTLVGWADRFHLDDKHALDESTT
jgi:probable phosphoglycerate mutase